ncbi:metal-dependent hydrolase [Haloferax sp. Q22]|uniref:metal-dependent hydrolase n=1 Tax=Haloferax sp. (strain Q22) TaxID=1526048 RepID=UPI000737AF1A|nr:metal-dependent hydrolase [Haloferax sp. Q22]
MYPLGHLALGYLLVVALARVRDWKPRFPHGLTLLILAVGTQLPDLIDKPLAYAGVLPNGRSLAHSLLIVVPVVFLGVRYLTRRGYQYEARALAVAIGSHIVGDSYLLVLRQEWRELGFLLWPVVPGLQYPGDDIAPWIRILNAGFDSPHLQFQYLLFVGAAAIWLVSVYRRRRRPVT